MRTSVRLILLSLVSMAALALPLSASADVAEAVSTFTYTKNMKPLGYSPRMVPLSGAGSGIYNSDLAFWGRTRIRAPTAVSGSSTSRTLRTRSS